MSARRTLLLGPRGAGKDAQALSEVDGLGSAAEVAQRIEEALS
jgi:hypothetical protein